jgi:hypothetical protein
MAGPDFKVLLMYSPAATRYKIKLVFVSKILYLGVVYPII